MTKLYPVAFLISMLIVAGHTGHAQVTSLSEEAEIVIGEQPQNTTVMEGRTAEFSVEAFVVGTDHDHLLQPFLEYQWQRDGEDIEGATSASYSTGVLSLADDGAEFRVVVFLSGCAVEVSDTAVLTVDADEQPPEILSAAAIEQDSGWMYIGVCFDKALDPVTAENPDHYLVDGSTPSSAVLQENGTSVQLRVWSFASSTFNVTVDGVEDLFGGNVANTSAQGQVSAMKFDEIGGTVSGAEGSTLVCSEGTFLARTAVRGLRSSTDTVHFIYQQITGDFDVAVQFTEMDEITSSTRGGLMVRGFLTPQSFNYWIGTYPETTTNYWVATMRTETGGGTVIPDDSFVEREPGFAFPNAWVRLQREGSTIRGHYSTDGVNWTQLGDDQQFEFLPDTLYVGMGSMTSLASADVIGNFGYRNYGPYDEFEAQFAYSATSKSHVEPVAWSNPQDPNTQAIGDFEFEDATVVIQQDPQDTSVEEGKTGMFSVQATAEGSSDDRLEFQWQRNGVDIDGATSSSYVLSPVSIEEDGDEFRVIVYVPGCSMVTSETATLDVYPDVVPPGIVSTASLDGEFVGVCFDEAVDPATAENPANYSLNGGASVTEAVLREDGESVKLTVSGLTSSTFSLTVNGVQDLFGNAGSASADGRVLGLTMDEIGGAVEGFEGSAFVCSEDAIEARTAVRGLRSSFDTVHFLHEQVTGDFDFRVQFTEMEFVNSSTRGGLMIRESLAPDARNYWVGTYPETTTDRWVATARFTEGGGTPIPDDSFVLREDGFAFPNAWVRLKREGETISVYYGTDGVNWTQLGHDFVPEVPYPDTVYVGLGSMTGVPGGDVLATFGYRDYGPFEDLGDIVRPPLSLVHSGGELILSWPASLEEYSLYYSDDLQIWNPVSDSPFLENGSNVLIVPMDVDRRFFRLQR